MDASATRAQATRLHRAGQLDAAERLYQHILVNDAADLEARHMLGVLWLQRGRAAEALELFDVLAAAVPASADVRTHRGLALDTLGRVADALADFSQALALRPDHSMALLYRGDVLLRLGRPGEALTDYEKLTGQAPDDAEVWFRRGNALWQMDRPEEAAASHEKAHGLDPAHFGALFNRATALMRLECYDQAFAAYEKARALAPANPYLLGSMAGAVLGGCDLARWEEYRVLLTEAVRTRGAVIPPLTFTAFCDDAALQRQCSEMFVADRVPASAPLWRGERHAHDRIRIAYLSSDFHQHATAHLMAGLFERHDRSRFEVTAMSFSPDDASPMRARLVKAFDHFIDVRGKSDAEAAALLRTHEIDIAIDLKGHTDNSRPGILSNRPCPVQLGYLGYPGTIGAPWLDYILADAVVLPFDRQAFHSEKIVHLPHCYQVNDGARPIPAPPPRADLGLPEDGLVFCCFNGAWKFSPSLFDLWVRLLGAVPGSVLWLLEDNAAAVNNLRAAAAQRGIDPARLIFAPRAEPADHLARHARADLFLDTLPYNAHTTASDALWAGLPLITCRGESFPGRVAASLLTAVGLPELVTSSLEDYEILALALAADPARLAALRRKLTENRKTMPLFDTGLFCRHIEWAYGHMITLARRGDAPQSFAVPL